MEPKPTRDIRTCTLYVEGMHCAACEVLIERKSLKIPGVQAVDAVMDDGTVTISGTFDAEPDELAREITKLVEPDGYSLSAKPAQTQHHTHWKDFLYAVPIAAIIIGGFIMLQKLGVVNLVNPSKIDYLSIFLIGVVASLSSCMAVVGGLVLSISANYAKETLKDKYLPQLYFHVSRIVSFFVLGGVIGLLGAAFTLTTSISFALSLIVAVVMILLAINLLDIFKWKFAIKLPKRFSHSILDAENLNGKIAPFALGALTFFLPCGFTQSMQLYALSTGSVIEGALTMLAFALGTLPVLAFISFASVNFAQSIKASGIFFKTAGLIVLFFAIINIIGALVVIGLVSPVLNF